MVFVNRWLPGVDVPVVRSDGQRAVRDLVAHLYGLGHRRLAIIAGPAATTTGRERVDAFREALGVYGLPLPDAYIGQGDFQADSGRRVTEGFLDLAEPPEVVLAADNLTALGALDAIRACGSGFAEGLEEYPGIKVVAEQPADFDRTKGLDVMTNLLQAHPGIDGVFAENDEMALGAIKALGSKAGKSVQVVGFDGTPDGLKAVGEGTLYASVAQQPRELGRIAVDNALCAVEGKKVDETVMVPVKVVTKENVAGFGG
ncbi:hypothetical protein GCM10027162_48370 [Streptomyces incanus]